MIITELGFLEFCRNKDETLLKKYTCVELLEYMEFIIRE